MVPFRREDDDRPPARWDPFREIEEAWTRMGSLLTDVAGGQGRRFAPWGGWGIPVDVEEADDAFVVRLDLPGVRREDVNLELRDTELYVTGEIKEVERAGVLRRQSRPVGRFEHRVALPGEVDPDAVEAGLTDGVLTVRLGKAPHAKPRRIEITF